jgi:hypothetical protein
MQVNFHSAQNTKHSLGIPEANRQVVRFPLIRTATSWLNKQRFPKDRHRLITDRFACHVETGGGGERVVSDEMFGDDDEKFDGELRDLLRVGEKENTSSAIVRRMV